MDAEQISRFYEPKQETHCNVGSKMKKLIILLAVACLAGCGKMSEGIDEAVAKSIPDGEVMILTSPAGNALLVLSSQTMEPENMDFALYFPNDSGVFDITAPSVSKQDESFVAHSPFRIGWSGATRGKGYLYPTAAPSGGARPTGLAIYRTRTNDLHAIRMDFSNITYDRIE